MNSITKIEIERKSKKNSSKIRYLHKDTIKKKGKKFFNLDMYDINYWNRSTRRYRLTYIVYVRR